MDRLTLPKRQPATEGGSSLNAMILNPPAGVPPSPLPTWAALSYDSKLPMIPGPKGAVKLFTTKMGERVSSVEFESYFVLRISVLGPFDWRLYI